MMEQEDEQDILPDTNIDRERTLTGKWALFVLVSPQFFGHKLAYASPLGKMFLKFAQLCSRLKNLQIN